MGAFGKAGAALWPAVEQAEATSALLALGQNVGAGGLFGAVALGLVLHAWWRLHRASKMRSADPLGCGPPR